MSEEIVGKKSAQALIDQEKLIAKIDEADNILISTSQSPHIDQVVACVGLYEILQDMGKNAVVVHSGIVSKKLDFLKPDDIVRKDAESLRDLIISFAQSKVEKFRYSRDNDQYNIMLTPNHRELIDEKDIEFSKGDFNIDLVLTLGVNRQSRLDTEVGKHDQLINDIPLVNFIASEKNLQKDVMTWQVETASALTEMVFELGKAMDCHISSQAANALLTGLIVETERFKNAKTKPEVMHIAGEMIALGANPLLIVNALEKTVEEAIPEMMEAKQMVEDALGDADEYDMQKLAQKRKRAGGKSKRLYVRQGDADEAGVAFGETAGTKKEQKAHVLDQLNIDAEGNLKVLSEEDKVDEPAISAANNATQDNMQPAMAASDSDTAAANTVNPPAVEANVAAATPEAHSMAPAADMSAAPELATAGVQPREAAAVTRDVVNPSAEPLSSSATPTMGVAPPIAAPSLADMPAGVAPLVSATPEAAPNISEMVDRGAPPIAAPSLSEKVAAFSPLTAPSATDYVDNLASANAETPPTPPADGQNAFNQALTVDNYTSSQQSGPVDPTTGSPYASPPIAPPLPSMS